MNAMTLQDFVQFKAAKAVPCDYPIDSVIRLYSPFDSVHDAFKFLIAGTAQSLYVSMYGEDDPELTAEILNKAKDPNIFVQVNLDKTQAAGSAESPLVAQLKACPTTRVVVGTSANGLINHLKMVVVDGLFVLSGSTNWSKDGEGLGDGKHGQNNEASIAMNRALAHEAITILNVEHETMLQRNGEAVQTQPQELGSQDNSPN